MNFRCVSVTRDRSHISGAVLTFSIPGHLGELLLQCLIVMVFDLLSKPPLIDLLTFGGFGRELNFPAFERRKLREIQLKVLRIPQLSEGPI
jgi:hypothetical protein